ncbi:MAG: type IVB secretion system coupling complex protein DotM/IcmP [Gammaproteobacteria bacterium]
MAAQQPQGQSDNSMSIIWMIVFIFAFIFIIWHAFSEQIITAYLKLKLLEIALISNFTDVLAPMAQWIHSVSPAALDFKSLEEVSNAVGVYVRWPVLVVLAGFSLVLFLGGTKNRFRNHYDMQRLAKEEADNWPLINATIRLNLADKHVEKGQWAMAMTPMDFSKKHKLLKVEMKNTGEFGLKKDIRPVATVIRGRANKAFARQLGPTWTRAEDLPLYGRTLFAIFAARALGDREAANALLRQIAESAGAGKKLDFRGADDLLKRHVNDKKIKKVVDGYSYVYTVMAAMLDFARGDGVLASAEFIWLKALDRPLWFMLNTVGRQTAPAEIAGPFSHWQAEKAIGHKLNFPMVEEATNALELAIEEMHYLPDDDEVIH